MLRARAWESQRPHFFPLPGPSLPIWYNWQAGLCAAKYLASWGFRWGFYGTWCLAQHQACVRYKMHFRWMEGWREGWRDGRMNGRIDRWTHRETDRRLSKCRTQWSDERLQGIPDQTLEKPLWSSGLRPRTQGQAPRVDGLFSDRAPSLRVP